MIQHIALQRLSVRDCFDAFVWQGERPAAVIEAPIVLATSWQTTSVQAFFGQYNWTGRELLQPTARHAELATETFSPTLPVKQFFDYFVWSGPPLVAPQPMPDVALPSNDRDFKLSNFADLF